MALSPRGATPPVTISTAPLWRSMASTAEGRVGAAAMQ